MNKKKLVVISGTILSLLVIVIVIIMSNSKGKVAIFFDTDGGIKVSRMTVTVGEKVKLPTTTKKGYDFDGWYDEDKKIGTKASFTKETTLTAHWKETEEKTMTITFNVVGGNKIEEMTIECDKKLKLPTPTKEGYKFVNWTDKKGEIITNETKLTCEDITLKATWKKVEEKKTETKKQETKKEDNKTTETVKEVTYTCPEGYKLNGKKCELDDVVREKCPDNAKADGDLCINTSDYNSGTRVCKTETVILDNNGHTDTTEGEYYQLSSAAPGTCGYHVYTQYTNSTDCTASSTRNAVWANNKCYAKTIVGNYTTQCSDGYKYYSSDELSTKFGLHNDGKCLKIVSKEKYCLDGWNLQDNDTRCVKTIE